MATIRIPLAELGSFRFAQLQDCLECSREKAFGIISLFWAEVERRGIERGSQETLEECLLRSGIFGPLLRAGYLKEEGDNTFAVSGFEGMLERKRRRKEISVNAIAAREAKRVAKPKKERVRKSAEVVPAITGEAWQAYAEAFELRCGTKPTRNRMTNSLMKQFVERVGVEDAPHVLRFYVSHTKKIYIDRLFPLNMAVQDAEGLHVQWQRGHHMDDATSKRASEISAFQKKQADIAAGRF